MTTINLFHTGDAYIFKHYFDDSGLFDELRDYYDSFEYRFEVNKGELGELDEKLEGHGYENMGGLSKNF
ncbi:hypothetical protein AKJ37_03145 [candidate division MSBL1 archaeon SCGC-AAA259I09]|uniref:Uncharacterized protein n=1 Tax=candidate division MSBL1 archaeon SCGC-AAA259I09 TaxID=1698267 RepID=A0A133USZ2_9EURY|nr:hypothetical protein AKJ37_03145 [candidate division MSBL1 archaeon SCGC-AAA259I09]